MPAGPGSPPQPAPPSQPFDLPADSINIEIEPEPSATSAPSAAMGSLPGTPRPPTREEIGKICPYCRFPIKPREQIIACPACKIPHHVECWRENGGCTTYGCRGGAISSPPPTPTPVPTSLPPGAGGPLPSPEFLRANELLARANNALLLSILGLLCCLPLSLVGIFVALAVLREVGDLPQRQASRAQGRAAAAIVLGVCAIVFWIVYLIIANTQG